MRIIESKKPLIVKVSQENLTCGVQRNKNCCVFANALHSMFPDLLRVEVGASIISLLFSDKEVRYMTSEEARKAIKHYDDKRVWILPIGEAITFGLPMRESATLKAGWARVKAARAQGKMRCNGARAGFPRRKAARAINPRHHQFLEESTARRLELIEKARAARAAV